VFPYVSATLLESRDFLGLCIKANHLKWDTDQSLDQRQADIAQADDRDDSAW
jgi:hypothetical protein